jgi:hypothetical protein
MNLIDLLLHLEELFQELSKKVKKLKYLEKTLNAKDLRIFILLKWKDFGLFRLEVDTNLTSTKQVLETG